MVDFYIYIYIFFLHVWVDNGEERKKGKRGGLKSYLFCFLKPIFIYSLDNSIVGGGGIACSLYEEN